MVPLRGSEREPNTDARVVGKTAPETTLDVTVRVRPRQNVPLFYQDSELEPMSREAWEDKYGADPSDIEKILQYASESNLKVEDTSLSQRRVLLSGTASAFTKAFQVDLKDYEFRGSRFRGRSGPVYVPESLEKLITGVFGLSDESFAKPHFRWEKAAIHPTMGVSRAFTPVEIAQFYNFPSGLDGQGEVVGVIELAGGYRTEDLNTYFKEVGVSPPKITEYQFPGGGRNEPGVKRVDRDSPNLEVMLDIEVIGAVAPGAKIVLYFAASTEDQSFLDVMTAAVHDTENRPSVICLGWGGPEASATSQFQRNFDQVLQEAGHLGITVCVAAGDNGSADFPLDKYWDGKAHVDFPASSPFALSCGGTRIVGRNQFREEVVWHFGANEGTGGGVSRIFPLPDYQVHVGVPHAANPVGRMGRGVPDVAGNAAQESGYRVYCDGKWFPDLTQDPPSAPIGGTSAVAALWVGLIAILNQGLKRRVGFVNPSLYRLAQWCECFHDIVSGGNGDYQAGPGWDACTGLGVPNGRLLLEAMRNTTDSSFSGVDEEMRSAANDPRLAVLMEYFQATRALIEMLGLSDSQMNGTMRPRAQAGYPRQPGYAGQPTYPRQPGYAGQPTYPRQPGYAGQPTYPRQPGYPGQPTYPRQPDSANQSDV
jgi:kumamolisin